jgi:hypothetical protein
MVLVTVMIVVGAAIVVNFVRIPIHEQAEE